MKTRPRNPHENSGFALIVTLSLMVLITLLAVGMLSLSAVSLRTSSQSEAMQAARSNARLALMVAIGELQKMAGPDQRITAPAAISQPAAPTSLTGVWTGTLPTATTPVPDKTTTFLGYLASGQETQTSQTPTDIPDTSAGELLIGPNSLGAGSNSANYVRANKVNLIGGSGLSGRYAWSLLDEGVKAKVDLVRQPSTLPVSVKNQAGMGSPARYGMESIAALNAYDWFGNTDQSRMLTLATSSVMGNGTPESMPKLEPFQNDVTTLHRGLLTDSARGGLRKDLSRLFDGNLATSPLATSRVYDDSAAAAATPNPYWSQLSEYASLYTKLTSLTGGQGIQSKVPAGYSAFTGSAGTAGAITLTPQAPQGLVLAPVVVKVQMLFSLAVTKCGKTCRLRGYLGDPKGQYNVQLIHTPVVTLYNPYNVPISFNTMKVAFNEIPVGIRLRRNGKFQNSRLVTLNEFHADNYGGVINRRTFGMSLVPPGVAGVAGATVVMQPGENIVFGEAGNAAGNWADLPFGAGNDWQNDASKSNNLFLRPGYPASGVAGFWCDIVTPESAGVTADDGEIPGDEDQFYLFLTDTVGAEFAPMRPVYGKTSTLVSNNPRFAITTTIQIGATTVNLGCQDFFYGSDAKLKEAFTRGQDVFPMQTQQDYTGQALFIPDGTLARNASAKTFAAFSFYAKTTKDSNTPARPWLQGSNTSMVGINLDTEKIGIHPFEGTVRSRGPNETFPIDAGNRGKFFTGNTDLSGTRVASQYEIPQLPLQNVAQLRHAALANPGFLPSVTYTVGESFATSLIPKANVTAPALGGRAYPLLDHTWLANNALWDGYFFSSISPQSGPLFPGTDSRTAQKVADDFFAGTVPLLNPRMVPAKTGNSSTAASDIIASNGYLKSAAHLMIDGAFNVNSLSVEAWKAFLSSQNKQDVDFFQVPDTAGALNAAVVGTAGTTSAAKNPFSRMRRATGKPVESANVIGARHARWNGMRTLTDAEIGILATNIVGEIKKRGPFLSLAEFVNRKPGSDTDAALKGALQAAIDQTTTINDPFSADSKNPTLPEVSQDGFAFPEAMKGMSAAGAPGYLTQGDILSSLGSVISVRSDTFRIRTYGEALDKQGNVIGKAWAEAVVQRVPEFVDSTNAPDTVTASLSTANQKFGRRYAITSFRWLTPAEI
jgi:Tfp pilus assembly protein PilX